MARLPRFVIPGIPHHVTQRDNRREDEAHLCAALRYVALNPVRAAPVAKAQDWPWSSVRAHLAGESDGIVAVEPALERVGNFAAFLSEDFDEAMTYAALREAESVGRPIGSKEWLAEMEALTGMALAPQKRGPKRVVHD